MISDDSAFLHLVTRTPKTYPSVCPPTVPNPKVAEK
jgi:hypothetical protein